MDKPLFYASVNENFCIFDEQQSLHCAKVLRIKEGDDVLVTDGKGGLFECKMESVLSKTCTAIVVNDISEKKEDNFRIHIAIGPTKNIDRLEWFLEKATEVGIHEITPIICQRAERTVLKPERLEKILISAMKQSQQSFLPSLHCAVSYRHFLEATKNLPDTQKMIAYCGPSPLKQDFFSQLLPQKNILIAIGPEGDFTPEEIEQALQNQFTPVQFPTPRLRTETAALYASWAVHFKNNEQQRDRPS